MMSPTNEQSFPAASEDSLHEMNQAEAYDLS